MTDWERRYIAEHEAAHAVAAMAMGLKVAWVDITQGYAEGVNYMAAVGIEIDGDEEDHNGLAVDASILDEEVLLGVCVSMATPSFIEIHDDHPWLGRYSRAEASLAYEKAGRAGIQTDEIIHRCEQIVVERWGEILDLSERLVQEGRVEFAIA